MDYLQYFSLIQAISMMKTKTGSFPNYSFYNTINCYGLHNIKYIKDISMKEIQESFKKYDFRDMNSSISCKN